MQPLCQGLYVVTVLGYSEPEHVQGPLLTSPLLSEFQEVVLKTQQTQPMGHESSHQSERS